MEKRYVLGIEPELDVRVMLRYLARQAHASCGLEYEAGGSSHVALVPDFRLRSNISEEELIRRISDATRDLVPFTTTTKNIEYFLTPPSVVLTVEKTPPLDSLHRDMLRLVKRMRVQSPHAQSALQRDYGSDFVLHDYHPWITIANIETASSWPTDSSLSIGKPHIYDVHCSHVSILVSGIASDRTARPTPWQSIYSAPLSRKMPLQ